MKQKLSKENSRKLIELGIPADKASASVVEETHGDSQSWTYPVFTIGDLLDVLPKRLDESLALSISFMRKGKQWCATYVNDEVCIVCKFADELIDALFTLVLWCVENGYIKTEKQ